MFNKKRKAIILFFLLVGITRAISAQELNDSVYTKFKKCLYGFLEKEQKGKKDSLLIFFKPESILFGKSYQSGGVIYSVQTKSLDSANSKEEYTIGNKCFIDSHKSFDFFLNSSGVTPACFLKNLVK